MFILALIIYNSISKECRKLTGQSDIKRYLQSKYILRKKNRNFGSELVAWIPVNGIRISFVWEQTRRTYMIKIETEKETRYHLIKWISSIRSPRTYFTKSGLEIVHMSGFENVIPANYAEVLEIRPTKEVK
jgi:hypothetical protein